jgi:hypothetical protein
MGVHSNPGLSNVDFATTHTLLICRLIIKFSLCTNAAILALVRWFIPLLPLGAVGIRETLRITSVF